MWRSGFALQQHPTVWCKEENIDTSSTWAFFSLQKYYSCIDTSRLPLLHTHDKVPAATTIETAMRLSWFSKLGLRAEIVSEKCLLASLFRMLQCLQGAWQKSEKISESPRLGNILGSLFCHGYLANIRRTPTSFNSSAGGNLLPGGTDKAHLQRQIWAFSCFVSWKKVHRLRFPQPRYALSKHHRVLQLIPVLIQCSFREYPRLLLQNSCVRTLNWDSDSELGATTATSDTQLRKASTFLQMPNRRWTELLSVNSVIISVGVAASANKPASCAASWETARCTKTPAQEVGNWVVHHC